MNARRCLALLLALAALAAAAGNATAEDAAACDAGQALCHFGADGEAECCMKGETCVKDVGCRCADDHSSSYPCLSTLCSAKQTACIVNKELQCCREGEECQQGVGCRCKPGSACDLSAATASSGKEAVCKPGHKLCESAPGKSECCAPGFGCSPGVGCVCLRADNCGQSACPASQSRCDYAPGKSQCCRGGATCVPKHGCLCKKKSCLEQGSCPDGGAVCESRTGGQCCFPGEKCQPGVGCQPTDASMCESYQKLCRYGPDGDKTECCYPGETCMSGLGCRK
eukprot:PLAT11875.1.p1 GENE.PLAT11875.1~~PLAT11875.1.p1  ORF type:complete len:299 (+),score=58.33 PLAT11875.1:49-897(+)